MGFEITDGTGGGFGVKVDYRNRLYTETVQKEEYAEAAREGNAYTVNSGYVTLTGSSATSAILFLTNDGNNDIVIDRINLSVKDSAGTTETHGRFIFYRNPGSMTNGTSVSVTTPNLNFGSSNTLEVTTERGQNGAGFTTTSDVFGSPVVPLQNITFISSVATLPKGSSVGFSFVTPTSNTSVQVAVGLNVYETLET
jgi:hypothetical protein